MSAQQQQQQEQDEKPSIPPRLYSTSLSSSGASTSHELLADGEDEACAAATTTTTTTTMVKKQKTSLQQLMDNISASLAVLPLIASNNNNVGGNTVSSVVNNERLEPLAILILESMTTNGRIFHNIHHVFDISQKADGITMLSALFHDVVYYSIGGFTAKQAEMLQDVVDEEDGKLSLKEDINEESDAMLAMVLDIYGFKPGMVLSPFGGLNEFLSAVIAVRALTDILPPAQLAQIAACIEATIPFRPIDSETGNTPAELLYQRFVKVNEKYKLEMNEEEIVDTIHRSVDLTNRDVGNFASPNTGYFLEQTWKLLPESNIALRHRAMYSVFDYYLALFKLEKFFAHLDYKVVFRYFRDLPSETDRRIMFDQAALNIEIGCGYIRAKLLSIAVLAAMAQLSGGDAPMSLFVGDLPSYNSEECDSVRLDDQFPPVEDDDDIDGKETAGGEEDSIENKIYKLLAKGRKADSSFDSRSSPMAAFLYHKMKKNNEAVQKSLTFLSAPMMDNETCKNFLRSLPRDALGDIASRVAFIAEHRGEKILYVVEDL